MATMGEASGNAQNRTALRSQAAKPLACPFCNGPMFGPALYCFSCWLVLPQHLRFQYAMADETHRPYVAEKIKSFLTHSERRREARPYVRESKPMPDLTNRGDVI